MESLEYQKKLAEFDEQIAFHKAKAEQVEHEKARFVLAVLSATLEEKKRTDVTNITKLNKNIP